MVDKFVPSPFRVLLLAIPFFLPVFIRIFQQGHVNPVGILSDVALGALFLSVALASWRWLQAFLLVIWVVFQVGAGEMLATMQRFPTWQDLHFLADPTFVENSASGFQLASPVSVGLMVATLVLALLTRVKVGRAKIQLGFVAAFSLLVLQGVANRYGADAPIADRFNPLHWFIRDAVAMTLRHPYDPSIRPPTSFNHPDLNGTRLIGNPKAKNLLIVTLEGIPGLYYPEIRQAMGIHEPAFTMKALADQTANAMLVPDFVDHSHQTIRGLYAMLCGDISKLSMDTPKATEILSNPERASQCLPAQMAKQGFSTHFLQGAGLAFMGKDRFMPAIGFQQIHGSEWFTEKDDIPFQWGPSDPAFFKGVRKYVAGLQRKDKPWMLTLMTVGTHQPYAVPDAIVKDYPSRLLASVGVLDKAVAELLLKLEADGVLKDTLVVVTSDESHGSDVGDWVSSWGMNIIVAPENGQLPRIKKGTYGLMDMEASMLDYFNLTLPPGITGRSFFRDYSSGRDMASFTSGKLRWQTSDNRRFECSMQEGCRICEGAGILGHQPANCQRDDSDTSMKFFAMASVLDHNLRGIGGPQIMRFANGEIRALPERLQSEWTDNIIGAQYLDFPAKSKVHVAIRLKAPKSNASDVQMHLNLRQWEKEVGGIQYAPFPLLRPGEETKLEFDFDNPEARQSFSFHLFGEAAKSKIQLEEFTVVVAPQAS